MPDILTKEQRSYCMSRIRGKDTAPEIDLRKAISGAGLRGYRLHYKLPGKPDVVFPRRRIAIFIDGCFWHRCPKCFVVPETNNSFWMEKLANNMNRDRVVDAELKRMGWQVVRIWEHEIPNKGIIQSRVIKKVKHAW